MNKKVFFLSASALFAIGLYAHQGQAMNKEPNAINRIKEDNPELPSEYERILLHGSLDYGVGPNAIIAGANENAVYIHFNQSFGNVSISIYNGTGLLVYSAVANTDVQQTYIIPIFSGTGGPYTIVLDSANGYAEGDFERN